MMTEDQYPGIDLHRLIPPYTEGQISGEQQRFNPLITREGVNKHCTDDVYEHACNITAWQQLYDQLRPGRFSGELVEAWLEGLQFFQERTSIALRQSCMVWPDALWIGLPLSGCDDGYIGSLPIAAQNIALRPGGTEFELSTPNDYTIMGIVVDQQLFRQYVCQQSEDAEQIERLMHSESLRVDERHKQMICCFLQEALKVGERQPGRMNSDRVRKVLRHNLLDGIVGLLLSAQQVEQRFPRSYLNAQRVVTQARDYILNHADQIITIVDLCQHLHVSRRTLQNCFQQRLGISPNTYLKAIRLNAVRRELESSYSQHQTIQDAAISWGFWHMSQFSADYQRLFGERPSASLAARGRLVRGLRAEGKKQ